jgi:protein-disulfide isomerase
VSSRSEQRRQARQEREKQGSEMSRFYWILGAVAVLGVAIVGYSVGSSALSAAATEPIDLQGMEDMGRLVELAQGVTKGDESAPITIVEFGDYQCPGCGAFALSVKPQVELSYVNSGRAKFVFYDLPLISIHANAFLAARAGRCAQDQGMFWEYHQSLFQNQSAWSTKPEPARDFEAYANVVGLEPDAFQACLRSDRHADVVTANMHLAEQLGLSGTPSILISRGEGMAQRLNNYDFQSIQQVVERMEAEIAAEASSN